MATTAGSKTTDIKLERKPENKFNLFVLDRREIAGGHNRTFSVGANYIPEAFDVAIAKRITYSQCEFGLARPKGRSDFNVVDVVVCQRNIALKI